MKFKNLLFHITCLFVLILTATKPLADSKILNHLKNEKEHIAYRIFNSLSELDDTEDPNEIFSRALNMYTEEFDSYLNITGLNVFDKEDITLPNFDINYVAPKYFDVMYEYEMKLQSKITPEELSRYNNFRKENVYFDKHITLIETKYKDLDIRPRFNPNVDIKIPLLEKNRSMALTTILSSAGLAKTIISAISGCVTALMEALSTSWIPFVGWVLAVFIATGALIALTAIIVNNWDKIRPILEDIRNWFLQEFTIFGNLINSFFADAAARGEESTIADTKQVGNKTLVFYDVVVTSDIVSKIVNECRRNYDVRLMQHIGNPEKEYGKHWWICYDIVDEEFVTSNRLYDLGICTYTWYNNVAKRMMANGSKHINGDYTLLIYETLISHNSGFGWNHYHLGQRVDDKVIKFNNPPLSWSHSLFGLLYIKENGSYKTYPTNP